jgi:transmembrane sensor
MPNFLDIEAQAANWLIRLDRDDSPQVYAEFRTWLASGPKNHATFLRLQKSWHRADYLKNVKPLDGTVDDNVLDTFPGALKPEVRRARERKRKNTRTLAIAASVVLAVIMGSLWLSYLRSGWQDFRTDLGGFQRIALQDGSIALLNTNSELRVRLTKERRELELVRGEALFTVAHDSARPFDVKAADTVVRAVGTAFSVRLRERQQVDVIVTEGRVVIDPVDASVNAKLAQSIPLPRLSILTAGETVRVSEHQLRVQKIDDEDVNRKLAWTKGRLSFNRVTLAEAVAEFNRYNRRQLVIDDPQVAAIHVSGAFDATDLDSFVAVLATWGIRVVRSQSNSDDPNAQVIRLVGSNPVH